MYKTVTHTGTYFTGCDHECVYCWAEIIWNGKGKEWHRNPSLLQKNEEEILSVRDAVVFLNSAHDSFANCIPNAWITSMLRWIQRQHPSNTFLLQTKNPMRIFGWLQNLQPIKQRVLLGTTIESTYHQITDKMSKAITVSHRAWALAKLKEMDKTFRTFLSLEPLFKFNMKSMLIYIQGIDPEVIEIGLDNYQQQHGRTYAYKQPSREQYLRFRKRLQNEGYNFIEKDSIIRWLKKGEG